MRFLGYVRKWRQFSFKAGFTLGNFIEQVSGNLATWKQENWQYCLHLAIILLIELHATGGKINWKHVYTSQIERNCFFLLQLLNGSRLWVYFFQEARNLSNKLERVFTLVNIRLNLPPSINLIKNIAQCKPGLRCKNSVNLECHSIVDSSLHWFFCQISSDVLIVNNSYLF